VAVELLLVHLDGLDRDPTGQPRLTGGLAELGLEGAEAASEGADDVPDLEADARVDRVRLPHARRNG
jgi:hypothetical protein